VTAEALLVVEDISLTVSPVIDAQNKIIGISKIARNITARKQAENRLHLLAPVSELIRTQRDSNELSYAIAQLIGKHFNVRRCLFNEIDLQNDREIVHQDYCDGSNSVAGVHTLSEYSSLASADMRAGIIVINCDSKTDPRTASDYDKTYGPSGERAYVAVPLMREGRWVASLWASDDRPRQWSKEEISLLQTVAERTWTAIENLRMVAALRESEERLRLATEAADMYAWEFDLNSTLAERSELTEIVLDRSLPDDLAAGVELVHPDDREGTDGILRRALYHL
jgi:GAF domain-containing protein